ncbi:MAG: hypothetical protein LBS27_04910 [Bifidobacteriaceae bacterium]|jgi:alkylhydroperoxidase/carboxymuconolactone decarboxylase family protein YurZ|nr:hypothetical protein [Bifidobacteriaceae bacterium]
MAAVSDGFMLFGTEFPETAKAHMGFVQAASAESALDDKTRHPAYLAVLAAAATAIQGEPDE